MSFLIVSFLLVSELNKDKELSKIFCVTLGHPLCPCKFSSTGSSPGMVYTHNRQDLKILSPDIYCETIFSRIRDVIICKVKKFIFLNLFWFQSSLGCLFLFDWFLVFCLFLASLGLRPRITNGIQMWLGWTTWPLTSFWLPGGRGTARAPCS